MEVMLWTMGVMSASQQVRPRASAASASGRKRSANICSCRRALFSLWGDGGAGQDTVNGVGRISRGMDVVWAGAVVEWK